MAQPWPAGGEQGAGLLEGQRWEDMPATPIRARGVDARGGGGFWQLLQLFTMSPRGNLALLAAMWFLTLANVSVASYAAAPIFGAFYQTLLERDFDAFVDNCKKAAALYLFLGLLTSTSQYVSDVLAVRWRARLTCVMHKDYLHPDRRAFCWFARSAGTDEMDTASSAGHCRSANKTQSAEHDAAAGLDNPDQRIASDAKLLCDTLAEAAQKVVSAPFMVAINAVLALQAAGWVAPVSISVYFVLSLAVNHILATVVSATVAHHQRLEGNLRTRHRWLCSRALDVGICGGARRALAMVTDALQDALALQLRVASRRLALNTAADAQMRMSAVVNNGAVAVAVFAAADSGWVWGLQTPMSDLDGPHLTAAISRACFYSLAICQGWSDLVKASVLFGDIRGYASRVRFLLAFVASVDSAHTAPPMPALSPASGEAAALVLEDVSVWSPCGNLLVEKLSLRCGIGEPLLITGPNGCGKSSLVAVIAGLCSSSHYTGNVTLALSRDQVMIVPQRPVLAPGTLEDLVTYPGPWPTQPAAPLDAAEYLHQVGLGYLIQRFGFSERLDWDTVLSPGEQQRLVIARLLLRRPAVAILDESTAAMGEDSEAELYGLLQAAGITTISIGHRQSLRCYHARELQLRHGGTWSMQPLPAG